MSHQIDKTKGKAAFVAYHEPAWHGLGKIYDRKLTTADVLTDGGLDFTVEKLPNIHRIGTIETVSTKSFFTYRTDNNIVLGTRLGKDYTVYQNTEALSIVDDLLKTGKCHIESAGSLGEGNKVFILLRLERNISVGDKTDVIYNYVLITNGHDGSLAITAMPTNVRVVCWNTLSAALSAGKAAKNGYKIRHTAKAAERVEEAFKIMGLLEQGQRQNEALYNAMKFNDITKADFYDYVGNIFLNEAEIKELQKGNRDAISSRKANVMGEVIDFAFNGIGQPEALRGGKINSWFAYNAINGYLTGKKYKNPQDRYENLLMGDSANKIYEAGLLAANMDKVIPLRKTKISGISLN